jgi:simple sugar transport system ATP-binding protein
MLQVEGATVMGDQGFLAVRDVSVELRASEILGIAGVAGNGQRELAEVVAGLRPMGPGRIWLGGRDISRLGPRQRWAAGIAYIPEDRLGEGLIGAFDVVDNAVLRDYQSPPISSGPFFVRARARVKAAGIVERFSVRAPDLDAPVRHLSGGNQQRLLVGRETWTRPKVLVAMHPTRGLDVDATTAVHAYLQDLRADGVAILLVSESLDELLAVADRLIVLHRGHIVGERLAASATREDIGLLMAGGRT